MTFGSPRSISIYSIDEALSGIQPSPGPNRARQGSPPTLKEEALMLESGMRRFTIPNGSAHAAKETTFSQTMYARQFKGSPFGRSFAF